jgi:hypothetical protein
LISNTISFLSPIQSHFYLQYNLKRYESLPSFTGDGDTPFFSRNASKRFCASDLYCSLEAGEEGLAIGELVEGLMAIGVVEVPGGLVVVCLPTIGTVGIFMEFSLFGLRGEV